MKNKRSRKLIRYDLQLKVVLITLFVASLVLLIHFQLSLAALWTLSELVTQNTSVTVVLEEMRRSIVSKFLISAAMAIPLAAAVGILFSFKFSGPIHRFKLFFRDLVDGCWDRPCKLRKGDDLQDICDDINHAMNAVCGVVEENAKVLERVRALVTEGQLRAVDGAEAKLQELTDEVDAVLVSDRERLPNLLGVFSGSSSNDSPAESSAPDTAAENAAAAPPPAAEASVEVAPPKEEVSSQV